MHFFNFVGFRSIGLRSECNFEADTGQLLGDFFNRKVVAFPAFLRFCLELAL